MTQPDFELAPLGDSALTVTLGMEISLPLHLRVLALGEAIRRAALPAIRDLVPGYSTVSVFYDPLRTSFAEISGKIETIARGPAAPIEAEKRPITMIPVRYDGADLGFVAEQTGFSVEEVIRRHSAPTYRVFLMGFVPGFAYLGGMDPKLTVPRRPTPRQRVAAGSVAIGGAQTGVYPFDTPGGWHPIGRTDLIMFDPQRSPPSLLSTGDQVRFEVVGS